MKNPMDIQGLALIVSPLTEDITEPDFVSHKGIHNGENDSHKRQFLALGVCSQSLPMFEM